MDHLSNIKSRVQLVYVGQITRQKGVPELIDAVLKCNSELLGCWILGSSEHSQELENELSQQVLHSKSASTIDFMGYKSDPRPFLKAANYLIAPSQYPEPLGNVVQEAKAQGTPSIVTPNGGLPETITHEKTGLILNGSSKEDLHEALENILRGKHRFDERNIIQESEEAFSGHTFTQKWEGTVLSVLNTRT